MKKLKCFLLSFLLIPFGISVASCSAPEEHLTLEPSEIEIIVGASKFLTATTDPAGQMVTWNSEDESIATVNRIGRVTGVAIGTTRVSVSLGEEIKYCNVTVKQGEIDVESNVTLNITYVSQQIQKPTHQLSPTVEGEAVECTYESDDTTVATVDNTGLITAVGVGNTDIIVTYGALSATVAVTVTGPENYYEIVSAQGAEVAANPGKWYMHTGGSASNISTYHVDDEAHLEINSSGANQTYLRYQVPNFEAGEFYQFTTTITVSKACYVRIACGNAIDILPLNQGANNIGVYGRELIANNCLGFLFLNSETSSDYAKNITAIIKDFEATSSINVTTKKLSLDTENVITGQIVVGAAGEYTYESDNEEVATVDTSGLVTAVSDGSTKVWVKLGDAKAYVTVSVSGKKIVLNSSFVLAKEGDNQTVTINTSESRGVTPSEVIWSVDDISIATVSGGVVTGVSKGETTLRARAGETETSIDIVIYNDSDKLTGNVSNFPHKKTDEMASVGPGWYKMNYYCNSIVMNSGVITLTNNDKTFKDVQQIRYLPDDGNGNVYSGKYYVTYRVTSGMQNSSGESITMTCQSQGYNDTTYQSELVSLGYGESATISHIVPAAEGNSGFLTFKLKYPSGFGTITFDNIYVVKIA